MVLANAVNDTRDPSEPEELTLLDILSNPLILNHTAPYLPIASLFSLAATSQTFRELIHHTPGVFRHLDLTPVKAAQFELDGIDRGGETWRNVQLDESLTEDEFYSGPLQRVFNSLQRGDILHNVQTLVLDGLAVTAKLCNEIIQSPSFNVRILSVRDAKHLNESQLRRALQYACRASRPDGAPRLKGVYIFTSRDESSGPKSSSTTASHDIGASWNHRSKLALHQSLGNDGDTWYSRKGKIIQRAVSDDWALTLQACHGIVSFDAVLCSGPRHSNSPAYGKISFPPTANPPRLLAVATHALGGCASCGSAPEGLTVHGQCPSTLLPLLAPPSVLTSTIRGATQPQPVATGMPSFVARCLDCIRERYCNSCHKWWCEDCYRPPGPKIAGASIEPVVVLDDDSGGIGLPELDDTSVPAKARITRSCWECGNNCLDCIDQTQRHCRGCRGGYCIIHNEGSNHIFCDWCSSRGRLMRHL